MKISRDTRNQILIWIGPIAFNLTALALYVVYDGVAGSASSNPLWLISLLIGAVVVLAVAAVIVGAIVLVVCFLGRGSEPDQSHLRSGPQ